MHTMWERCDLTRSVMHNFRGLLHLESLACGSYQPPPPVQPSWGMEARATVGIRHQYAPVSVAGSGTLMYDLALVVPLLCITEESV